MWAVFQKSKMIRNLEVNATEDVDKASTNSSLSLWVSCWNIWFPISRGAGSEVWNRVYMIAPVKKFGRVRLPIRNKVLLTSLICEETVILGRCGSDSQIAYVINWFHPFTPQSGQSSKINKFLVSKY